MYRIIKPINENTFFAENNNRVFVLKMINPGEIDIVKKLMSINNRNVVRFIDFTTIDYDYYCVEEYIDGETLEAHIRRFGIPNDEEAKRIIYEICLGLRDIHRLGIIHRDINPSNIMIDRYGCVKIIDFGISRINKPQKTADTQILGTHGYAAPEQYGFSQTSIKSDIYSLGVLINYIKTAALPNQVKAEGLLGEIAEKCTQIDESKRYNSVDEILKAIETGKAEKRKAKFTLPGYRSGKTANMIFASIYYILVFLILCIYLFDPVNIYETVFFCLMDIFLFFIPVFIFFNYLGWADNLSASKKRGTKFVCILYGILYEIITFSIFIIIYKPQ